MPIIDYQYPEASNSEILITLVFSVQSALFSNNLFVLNQ